MVRQLGRHDFKKGYLIFVWFLKQVAELIARYTIVLSVFLVVGSAGHFVIFEAVSGSMSARIMALNLFFLMIPSVIAWHFLCQLQTLVSWAHKLSEIGCALTSVVVASIGVFLWLPEVYSVNIIDMTLFFGTFIVAGGLCGHIAGWLKIKEWIHAVS